MSKVEVGKKVPDFMAAMDNEEIFKLSENKGKNLVIYFYPKDNTPGCTAQACNLTENQELLKNKGFEILGVSADSAKKHQNFISKYDLGFSLIADENKEVIKAYQVWGPKKFMGKEYDGIHRTTFVINEQGNIERVFTKVKTKEHANQILESYK